MIASAKQTGNSVKVYNEKGGCIFTKSGILVGFTSTTVTIKVGNASKTYNEKGACMFTK